MNLLPVIKHLHQLGEGTIKPIYLFHGLCNELDETFGHSLEREKLIEKLAANWYKYSGSIVYPIAGKGTYSYSAYELAVSEGTLWDANTTYGADRLEYCKYLADELYKIHLNKGGVSYEL